MDEETEWVDVNAWVVGTHRIPDYMKAKLNRQFFEVGTVVVLEKDGWAHIIRRASFNANYVWTT